MNAANEHVYCVLHCRGKAVGDRRSQTGGWWPQLVTVKPTTASRPERCVWMCVDVFYMGFIRVLKQRSVVVW